MSHNCRFFAVTTVVTVALAFAIPLSPPAAADDPEGPSEPGEFVVELKAEADADVVNRAVGGIGAPQRLSPASTLWLFHLDPATDPVDGTKLIQNTNDVVDAQPNHLAEVPEFFGGRIRYWTDLEPPDPTAEPAAATVDQPALGSAGLPVVAASGAGTLVAILDTGIDATHPALSANVTSGGHDFVDDDPTPAEELNGQDDNGNGVVDEAYGHGTYIAGIVRLVAADARIVPIRILDTDGTTTAWRILEGLDHAVAAGVDVINMSLGGRSLGDIVERSIKHLGDQGVAVAAAAGNSASTDLYYPAASDGVVAATAIDGRTGDLATFSNTGSWIDVAAPGVRVVSAYPGARAATWGGTSAAAPIVAATLALLRETMPTADVDDVVDKLTSTAIADGLDNVSAYGRIDVSAAIARATTS